MASLLQVSIANGVLSINSVQVPVVAQPGLTAGGGNLGATFGAQVPMVKDQTLRLCAEHFQGRQTAGSTHSGRHPRLPRCRTNSLLIIAPKESVELVLAMIRDLDVPPNARSEINIFTLKKSDATQLAIMLQQLFLGSGSIGSKAAPAAAPRRGPAPPNRCPSPFNRPFPRRRPDHRPARHRR